MAMGIDRILNDAVSGAQQGLFSARKNSSQLAAAGGGRDNSNQSEGSTTRVEKASDAELGNLVDVEA